MPIQLVPVLDIFHNTAIPAPLKGPYWNFPGEWEAYHIACLKAKGFTYPCPSRLPGASFYSFDAFTDHDLAIILRDHTEGYQIEEICPLHGGYILNMDGRDLFYPQCCGDLSDWVFWNSLAAGIFSNHIGHPQPDIKFKKDSIILDFTKEIHEQFTPLVSLPVLEVSGPELMLAVVQLKAELNLFDERLKKINAEYALGMENIGDLLIWGLE